MELNDLLSEQERMQKESYEQFIKDLRSISSDDIDYRNFLNTCVSLLQNGIDKEEYKDVKFPITYLEASLFFEHFNDSLSRARDYFSRMLGGIYNIRVLR